MKCDSALRRLTMLSSLVLVARDMLAQGNTLTDAQWHEIDLLAMEASTQMSVIVQRMGDVCARVPSAEEKPS